MKSIAYNFLERHQKKLLILVDIILILLAMMLSFVFSRQKYNEDLFINFFSYYSTYLGIITLLILFSVFRLYSYTWRYAGIEALRSVVTACIVGTMSYAFYELFVDHLGLLKYNLFVFCILLILFIGGARVFARLISMRKNHITASMPKVPMKNLIIIGANEEGARIIKSIGEDFSLRYYNIVGIVDYGKEQKGKYICNVKILGHIDDINKIIDTYGVDEVLFTLSDDYDGQAIKKYVLKCRQRRIPVKVVNSISDRINNKKKVTLQDINVEDLLRRSSRKIDLNLYSDYIKGKVVLITGAGGSIGSEIVRQVANLGPKQIVLLGHGENSIFKIHQSLTHDYPEMDVYPVIASISDKERIDNTFNTFKPEVVFHAAAHKHVPLMELNIHEAVRNNIVGTKNIVDACVNYKVKNMVQISTDKAADPSSVMGATKYVCEQIIKSAASKDDNNTKFVIVRFGNVLGSRGSVIPVFLRQIEQGGPVTVTDPDMTRYFMIIPEACRLVIQSGSIGENGKIYVLDMGEPVKIMDLAEDIISICGYVPNKDMEIKITGVRPGEKLHETLSSDTENLASTDYKGIDMVKSSEVVPYDFLERFISGLNSVEKTKNAKEFIKAVNVLKICKVEAGNN